MRIQVLDPQWKKMDPDPRSQYVADQTDKDPKQCLGAVFRIRIILMRFRIRIRGSASVIMDPDPDSDTDPDPR